METREASSALPVAIALARASEKVFGVGIVATRKLLRCQWIVTVVPIEAAAVTSAPRSGFAA